MPRLLMLELGTIERRRLLLGVLIFLIYFEDCACILTGTGTATTSGRTPAARTSSLPAGATATISASLPQKVYSIEKLGKA